MANDVILAPCPGCQGRSAQICRKAAPILCYYVRCLRCGRETAKHRKECDAVRDWNLCAERFVKEERNGTQGET